MLKKEAILWIYHNNFPNIWIHYDRNCKDPNYLVSKISIKDLQLPDKWHITPNGNIVRQNPNSWIPIIPR